MSMKKRMICLSMAGLLALSGPAPMFGQSTSSELFDSFIKNYGSMMKGEDRDTYMFAMYDVFRELSSTNFQNLIKITIDTELSTEDFDKLKFYEFGKNSDEISKKNP